MKKREELGHPLGQVGALSPPKQATPQGPLATGPEDLVIEIGCEELPPADAIAAVPQLRCRPCPCTPSPVHPPCTLPDFVRYFVLADDRRQAS